MKLSELSTNEYDPYYQRYLDKLTADSELVTGFEQGLKDMLHFFNNLPEDKLVHRYALDKWSVKEVWQHLIDTERVFIYRCFRIARRDVTALSGFDQTIYVPPSNAHQKSRQQLVEEYQSGRDQSVSILKSLSSEDLAFVGNANESAMSARAAAFTIIGHDRWHRDIIKERYL